jgi:elongation factor Ts
MAEISIEQIKELRERTQAGIMDVKRALQETKGDLDAAAELLRQRGLAVAEKKAAREARMGLVEAYVHAGGRIGALVEVNCETDFVARTQEFRTLAHNLALQVAAMNPRYISKDQVPPGEEGDPREIVLLEQAFIRDPSKTVQDMVVATIAQVGENIKVGQIGRASCRERVS